MKDGVLMKKTQNKTLIIQANFRIDQSKPTGQFQNRSIKTHITDRIDQQNKDSKVQGVSGAPWNHDDGNPEFLSKGLST